MPLILLLPYFPLATVLMSITCILASDVTCTEFACTDIVQDVADCDVCWCYENGGCACCCCMVCHDADHDPDTLYDDASDAFRAYAKKS
jgi:hypothetical protein